jgi:hypothetical protein
MQLKAKHIVLAAFLAVILSAAAGQAQSFTPSKTRAPAASRVHRLPAMLIQGIKYSADWSLDKAAKIKEFFLKKFGHDLPVSAMGQTETHDKLGFDHHEAMDVALSPDSKEGRTLIGFLRQAKIPFIAFRRRVEGSATGPHIHIGNPSQRMEIAAVSAEAPAPPVEPMPEAEPKD